METVRDALLHMHLIDHVGPLSIERIYQALGDQLSSVYTLHENDIRALGVGERTAALLVAGLRDRGRLDKALQDAQTYGYRVVMRWHPEYPELLSHIHQPPTVLFVRGNLPATCSRALAIVGSRDADGYARTVIKESLGSIPAGTLIVSGGALGADTYAHEAALSAGLPTVAVLGSGLLNLYPRENRALFEQIVASGGALVSSFHPQARPLAAQFPARNRIIAGLSHATMVVQAAASSGSLITAKFSLQEGREVGAVPGAITHPLSAGCHALIRQGALLLDHPGAVLQLLGIEDPIGSDHPKSPQPADSQIALADLANTTDPLVEACREPISVDELMAALDMDTTTLFARLAELEVAGAVTQTLTGQWLAATWR